MIQEVYLNHLQTRKLKKLLKKSPATMVLWSQCRPKQEAVEYIETLELEEEEELTLLSHFSGDVSDWYIGMFCLLYFTQASIIQTEDGKPVMIYLSINL